RPSRRRQRRNPHSLSLIPYRHCREFLHHGGAENTEFRVSLNPRPGKSRDPPFHISQAGKWIPAFAGTPSYFLLSDSAASSWRMVASGSAARMISPMTATPRAPAARHAGGADRLDCADVLMRHDERAKRPPEFHEIGEKRATLGCWQILLAQAEPAAAAAKHGFGNAD